MIRHRGYTLIEILIVLLLISIIGTCAVLSIGYNSNKQLESLAKKIVQRMTLAEQEAMLRPAVLAMTVDHQSLQFYVLNETNKQWRLMSDALLKKQTISNNIVITLDRKNIVFLPSGNLSPFTITIGRKNKSAHYFISGKANGDIVSGWLNET